MWVRRMPNLLTHHVLAYPINQPNPKGQRPDIYQPRPKAWETTRVEDATTLP